MALETPEVNGARQELPCLESPEIDGARQSVAAVKKYVDGAWTDVWTSFPSNYIIYNGKLSDNYTITSGTSTSGTYYQDSIDTYNYEKPEKGYYYQGIHLWLKGSATDATVKATFTINPKLNLKDITRVYVEMKYEKDSDYGYYEFDTTQSLNMGSYYPAIGDGASDKWTSEAVDDGYVKYTFNAGSVTLTLALMFVIDVWYGYNVQQWQYHHTYIRNIWFE